ncbi:hypothetical protein KPY62_02420 [Psychrobacter sp. TAE2020]|uniref:FlgO family outer membrane protein n=1 Tax=Psychrobacter sp. TAE2020 TaxID=2846762 RepID=UPI001C10162D|nr:FlgO family outer membrane protein [Psychrobacter sp. TAE2020]MBU5615974.1 hypothetical protein [Psychrobacter sp. TAE2020]
MRLHPIKILLVISIAVLSLFASPLLTAKNIPASLNLDTSLPPATAIFIPFTSDSILSPMIIKDLQRTELTIISENLPLHSPNDVADTSYRSQGPDIAADYLITGATTVNNAKIIINYKVVDIHSGQIIANEQHLILDYDDYSLRYGAHRIADHLYEIITNSQK